MCRVFMIPHIKEGKLEKTQEFVKEMARVLSTHEKDGVGYAALTRDGRVFGEKWVNFEEAFKIHGNPPPDLGLTALMDNFGEAIKFKEEPKKQGEVYGAFGDLSLVGDACAVILHARKKTIGDLCVENTHPFFYFGGGEHAADVDVALIHNGSIANHKELIKRTSTCDSEVILNEYTENQMNLNPWHIEQLAATLYGDYAVGVLSSTTDGDELIPILDVFKSNKDLFVGWIPELETFAFCTSEYNLDTGAKACGLTVQYVAQVRDGAYLRFNCLTGKRAEEILVFEPSKRGTDYRAENNHHRPSNVCGIGPAAKRVIADETSEDVRRNFQKNHPSVFNQTYHIPGNLTKEEQTYFDELKARPNVNHRALRLVAAATGK
jgi:hypothetical protein